MKQYKDELRAACLTYILALPKQIVIREIKSLAPALQVSRSRLLYIKQSYCKMLCSERPCSFFVQIHVHVHCIIIMFVEIFRKRWN